MNPTMAGAALVWTSVPNSAIEMAIPVAANLLTAGTGSVFSAFYDSQNRSGVILADLPTDVRLGASIAGVSDTLFLFVQPVPVQGATDFYGSINWLEQV